MSSAICFNLDQSKILSSDNGFKKRFRNYKPCICYLAAIEHYHGRCITLQFKVFGH